MSWNNNISFPNWAGSGIANNYVFPSISSINISSSNISASNISTYNLTAYNGFISYNSNITTTTNAVILNPGTILTGNNGSLYVNGVLLSTPSNISSIGDWSKFQAISNVNMNSFSLNNVSNITASNQISANTFVGATSVVAPDIQAVSMSATNGNFPALTSVNLTSSTHSNSGNFVNTGNTSLGNDLSVAGYATFALDIQCDTIIRTPNIDTSFARVFKELRVAPISPVSPNIGTIISPSTIVTDTLIARNSISTILISTGSLFANTVDVGSNLIVPNIDCSNITVVDTATIETLNVEGTATIYTLENTFGANFQAGASVENVLNVNCDVDFPFNTTADPLVLPPQTQPLYDMSYIRNITCGGILVQGGWNGNTVLPPYHNASLLTVGNSGGLTSQGVVQINGQLPDPANPGTNLTTALTVYGDVEIGGISPLNWGTLTSYNGCRLLGENPDGLALEVAGIVDIVGVTNITGATTIEGATGILGNTTITGALEVTGGCLFTGGLAQLGGDFTLGANGTTFTGTINTPLTINNNTSFNNFNINNVGTLTATNVNATNINATNFTTSNIFTSNATIPYLSTIAMIVYPLDEETSGAIVFTDISGGINTVMGQSYDTFLINTTSSIVVLANEGDMILASKGNASLGSTEGNASLGAPNGAITLNSSNQITLTSDDGGIGLDCETGIFMNNNYGASLNLNLENIVAESQVGDISLTAGSNIILQASNNIFCESKDEYYISTIKITLTRDVYMSNIYGIGGTNIRVNDNINMSNSVLYAGSITADYAYISTLSAPVGSSNAINVVNPLNMTNQNISNVNKMYYASTRQPFIQFGSNTTGTGAGGTTVTLPVPYANSNYAIQLTYIGQPAGNQVLHTITQTTSNFSFHGHNNSLAYWTTLGFNN
jgi:hypothetical protein